VGNVPIGLPIGTVLGRAIGWSIPVVCVLALFLLIYRVLPNVKQGWRHVAPGALLSSVLLLVISQVFPLYVTLFPPNQAYALFGVFLVFTFWLYLVGIILVLGAELNAFLQEPTASATPGGPFEAQDAERPRNHLIANAPRTNVPATIQASHE
ncbi:MAG TPA: YihY/virulence factor BrkB family protein, partial [Chloroflexota bacterium]